MRPTLRLSRPLARGALWASLLALLCAVAAGGAWALSEREIEQRVHRIADQLRCPTCQAISVNDSEASFSRQIREKVRRMVEEGQSDEDIKAYFVSRYGEWILRAPKKEGLGLVLWVAPGAALVLAGGLIGYRAWRSHQQAEPGRTEAGDAGPTPEQRERIARDLERFEEEE